MTPSHATYVVNAPADVAEGGAALEWGLQQLEGHHGAGIEVDRYALQLAMVGALLDRDLWWPVGRGCMATTYFAWEVWASCRGSVPLHKPLAQVLKQHREPYAHLVPAWIARIEAVRAEPSDAWLAAAAAFDVRPGLAWTFFPQLFPEYT